MKSRTVWVDLWSGCFSSKALVASGKSINYGSYFNVVNPGFSETPLKQAFLYMLAILYASRNLPQLAFKGHKSLRQKAKRYVMNGVIDNKK